MIVTVTFDSGHTQTFREVISLRHLTGHSVEIHQKTMPPDGRIVATGLKAVNTRLEDQP